MKKSQSSQSAKGRAGYIKLTEVPEATVWVPGVAEDSLPTIVVEMTGLTIRLVFTLKLCV